MKKITVFLLFTVITMFFISFVYADEYTKLLIQSDTFDSDTTFMDTSDQLHPIDGFGDIHHSIVEKKFGSTSIYFDGEGDYLQVPGSTDWLFNGDFTIDFWVKTSDHSIYFRRMISFGCNYLNLYIIKDSGRVGVGIRGAFPMDQETNTIITDNQWHHIALVRSGSEIKLYVDGACEGTTSDGSPFNGQGLYIGYGYDGCGSSSFLNGYLDEIRVTKDEALWLTNFSPPESSPPPANPVCDAGPDQSVTNEVTLNGSQSTDSDGTIESYDWVLEYRDNPAYDLNATGVTPTVSNLEPGIYDVTLTVTDNIGLTDTDIMVLTVDNNADEPGCCISCDWSGWKESGNTTFEGPWCTEKPGFRIYCDDGKITAMEAAIYYICVGQFAY